MLALRKHAPKLPMRASDMLAKRKHGTGRPAKEISTWQSAENLSIAERVPVVAVVCKVRVIRVPMVVGESPRSPLLEGKGKPGGALSVWGALKRPRKPDGTHS